ncbi:MAG: SUMF1/EgtB/PvdO family nonheme iron enzyme [Cyanobacteria bacterium J06648_16]
MLFPSANTTALSAALSLPMDVRDLDDHRGALVQALMACRQDTLLQVTGLSPAVLTQQAHPDFSPVGWHLGHIAYTESLWVLEHLEGRPCSLPDYQQLFAADGLPKAQRQQLPDWEALVDYLARIRDRTLSYLEIVPADVLHQQLRLWCWLLQHESQHSETMTLVMALHQRQGKPTPLPFPPRQIEALRLARMVRVPAGNFRMGYEGIDAIDNERPQQTVYLPDYWIDETPVTWGQYQEFIEAGGYRTWQWWSEQGWDWLQQSQVKTPLYWHPQVSPNHPVSGVSRYEAEAYAHFVGKRLPTEAEWEKAAGWQPETGETDRYPWGHSPPQAVCCNYNHLVGHTAPVASAAENCSPVGCYDMLGNVWEWTCSPFKGYPGFSAYPYRGYSHTYFDGRHDVLKGGSWATRPWVLRNSFRNWYHPHVRELFMGFRCAQDA